MDEIDIMLTDLLKKGDNRKAGKIVDQCETKIREYYNNGFIGAGTFLEYETKVNEIRKSLGEIYFPLAKEEPKRPISKSESIVDGLVKVANRIDQNNKVIDDVESLINSFQNRKISKEQLLSKVKSRMQQWQRSR